MGFTNYLATYMLPVVLPVFKEMCPNIEVFIKEKSSAELDKALSTGEIDFAVMHICPFHEISSSLYVDFHPLFKDPFLLTAKKGHPLSQYAVHVNGLKYPKIDLTLFTKEPFIMINHGQRIRQVTEIILQKANINPIVAITTKSYETARRLACQGIGVAFVPLQYLRIFNGIYQPDYYFIDEKYSPYWTLCVAVQRNAYVSAAEKLFIRLVSEKFGSAILNL